MNNKAKKDKILETKNYEEFDYLLEKYYPQYSYQAVDKWDYDILRHYFISILGLDEKGYKYWINYDDSEVIEYNQIGTE